MSEKTFKSEMNKIQETFFGARHRWIDTPATDHWQKQDPDLINALTSLDNLYRKWSKKTLGPFNPQICATYLKTVSSARKVGLPWCNNGIFLPNEPPWMFPFHFKNYEWNLVLKKAARVVEKNGDELNSVGGYVCGRAEANQWALKALIQTCRTEAPGVEVIILTSRGADESVMDAGVMFNSQILQVPSRPDGGAELSQLPELLSSTSCAQRALIFAATVGNDWGGSDDLAMISKMLAAHRASSLVPAYLHVDAARTFDFLTTLAAAERRKLGLPRVILRHGHEAIGDNSVMLETEEDEVVYVATIIAGGLNFCHPPKVVVLKPNSIGVSGQYIEMVQGVDQTLSGSRDALSGLLVALQEERFGERGIQEIFHWCREARDQLCEVLSDRGIHTRTVRESLDLVVYKPTAWEAENETQEEEWLAQLARWGAIALPVPLEGDENYPLRPGFLLTLNPSVTAMILDRFLQDLTGRPAPNTLLSAFASRYIDPATYRVPKEIEARLQETVKQWQTLSLQAFGFPDNHATLSALGPVIGRMMTKAIPRDWAESQAGEILEGWKQRLGLIPANYASFGAGITTGSTMGNRIGILTALQHCPHGYFYTSTATHYSVRKTFEMYFHSAVDTQRYSFIDTDDLGRMVPNLFAQKVWLDKMAAESRGEKHQTVLLANFGTTFIGGSDDVVALRRALKQTGKMRQSGNSSSIAMANIDYIHADGALNFGSSIDSICLAIPDIDRHGEGYVDDASDIDDSRVAVQGITVSNHKFPGLSVSGLVFAYNASRRARTRTATATSLPVTCIHPRLPTLPIICPLTTFEIYLYSVLYPESIIQSIYEACQSTCKHLRSLLLANRVRIRYNPSSLVTLVERQPSWLIKKFNLSPEGEWVHCICMPHISKEMVEEFVREIVKARKGEAKRLLESEVVSS
jgi:glutamate/tyrosine decarboxylase-like PLP-dependent enzyme